MSGISKSLYFRIINCFVLNTNENNLKKNSLAGALFSFFYKLRNASKWNGSYL